MRSQTAGVASALVGKIEADHGQRPFFVKHDMRRLGVDFDIELRHRAPVAHMIATAHQHHFLDPLGNARLFAHRHGDIGQAAGRHQRHAAGRVSHHGIDDQIHRVARVQLQVGFRQHWAIEAGIAMNVGRHFDIAHQRAWAAGGEGHAGDIGDARHRQRVARHFVQRLITHHGGDRQQVDLRIARASSRAMASSCPGSQSSMIFSWLFLMQGEVPAA